MAEDANADIAKMSFEAALEELERIVEQLERGEVELEKSIAIYERGAALKAHCEKRLKDAQLKVDKIVLGPDGEAKTEPADLER
ncbi:exodeoxyribonuclease VII small subunit [Marinicauda salina]|uniref:Exodeoxyribonuclease 7 small subunit n=1 Tax=Marinicauda salina TaxID=2135793 RepID=A0A2U2BSK0_9PROT|nr:exodeoxyribonuclease VII small subunit [Marinicauda salina]PWE16956.1 exodeoxyribonuclease VII small subunit [Marinicauda salina]